MSPFRSSIRNAGAAPFYAPYKEEGGNFRSPAPPRAEAGHGYLHFSSLTRSFSGSCDSSSQSSARGVLAVLGGILVHICLGTVYTWGTLAVYVISYMRLLQEEKFTHFPTAEVAATANAATEQDVTGETAPAGVATVRLSDAAWIVACQFAGMALAMPLGGKVERKVGPSKTVLAGGAIMCAAVAAAPYVLHSYFLFVACYGLMQGAGLGVAYTAPLVCGLSWFPHRKGVVSGAITAGFGTGALLFSPLQAAYLNPLNIPPTFAPYPDHPAELYYDPNEAEERAVLLRIPPLLQRLALAYMLLLGAGAALLQPRVPTRGHPRAAGASTSSSLADGVHSRKREEKDLYPQPAQTGVASLESAAAVVGETEGGIATAAAEGGTEGSEDVEERREKLQVWATLRSRPFWSLWGLFFVNGLATCFTASFWRFLAVDKVSRTYILTEAQLAVVGAVASASNAAGRIGWGQIVDLKGFKAALIECRLVLPPLLLGPLLPLLCLLCYRCGKQMLLSALWSGLLLYLPNAARRGGLAYAVTVCGSFFCLGGNFAVFPSAVAALFGQDAIGHLYGYIFTSQLGSSLCFAFLTQRVVQTLGTDGLCTLMGLCCMVSAAAAGFLPSSYSPQRKQKERKDFFDAM